jgi:hypothetical protein
MKVVILQSNYMPWRGYFDLINDADVFCFYDEVKYTKNDWRNRNRIYSKNGLQWLTIPIDKNAVKLKISEVEMPEGWEEKHATTLKLSYGRAPQFKQIEELLNEVYLNNKIRLLSEFNQNSIKHICKLAGITTNFVSSADYELRGDRVDRLLNLLQDLGATEYISGPSAKDYLTGSEHLFTERGMKLSYKTYGPYKTYEQLSQPYEPAVSILDLVAHIPYSQLKDYVSSTAV